MLAKLRRVSKTSGILRTAEGLWCGARGLIEPGGGLVRRWGWKRRHLDGRARSAGAGRAGSNPEWDRKRHDEHGLPPGESGAVTGIQRANSDLRLNSHLHTISLDGVPSPDGDGKGQMFHSAPTPSQQDSQGDAPAG
jgi:hypothetical protein